MEDLPGSKPRYDRFCLVATGPPNPHSTDKSCLTYDLANASERSTVAQNSGDSRGLGLVNELGVVIPAQVSSISGSPTLAGDKVSRVGMHLCKENQSMLTIAEMQSMRPQGA
mmetsp:Transcript_17003/g.26341  ORF Transcript_17003/g.26341 Transcript_17003/m.26341 type:complete len:112 (+) Transcript_17003:65-400(+)